MALLDLPDVESTNSLQCVLDFESTVLFGALQARRRPTSLGERMLNTPPPLPLLVTGIAGVAGYNAFHYFRSLYPGQVIGTRRRDNWLLRGPGIEPCDLHDPRQIDDLFRRYAFASVLNGEGTCKLKSCELDPAMARRVNVLGAQNLVRWARACQARLVHWSIDLVFSGAGAGDHLEEDPVDPVTVYGRTMVEAERVIMSEYPSACVLRISLPMGVSFNGHAGAIDWIQHRFQKGKPATLYYDEIRTPKYTDCLNRVCGRLLCNTLSGLYHAGGPRKLSLYEIAQIVNRVGGYDPDLLHGCYRHEAGPIPPRAGNVTMHTGKLTAALGYPPFCAWPVDPRWVPTDREWHSRRDARPEGGAELLTSQLYRNPRYSIDAVPPLG